MYRFLHRFLGAAIAAVLAWALMPGPTAAYAVTCTTNPRLAGDLVATKHCSTSGFTDQQLDGSTSYSYTVKAFDGAGNLSAASATANVTTPAAPTYATNWAAGKTYTSTVAANASYPDTGGVELTDGVKATGPSTARPGRAATRSARTPS